MLSLMLFPCAREVTRAATLLLVAFGAFACESGNPACESDVRTRLLEECQLTLTAASGVLCLGLDGAPEMAERDVRIEAHRADACELEDPKLDAECLKTTSCEALINRETSCSLDETVLSSEQATCTRACRVTEQDCIQACSRSTTFDACLDCEVECLETAGSCKENCRG